jgi:hypothetical protein
MLNLQKMNYIIWINCNFNKINGHMPSENIAKLRLVLEESCKLFNFKREGGNSGGRVLSQWNVVNKKFQKLKAMKEKIKNKVGYYRNK